MAKAQLVKLDMGNCLVPLYCPYCGSVILDNETGVPEKPCPHVELVFSDAAGDGAYEYASPSMQALLESIGEGDPDGRHSWPSKPKLRALLPPDTLLLEISTWGVACGPIGWTTVVGVRWGVAGAAS